MNQVLFIINRHSGTGYRPSLEGKIIAACEKRDLECTIEFTQEVGHAIALAKEAAANKVKMVFAAGGDGTVNEVAQGLLNSSIPLGIIPKGSGNGLARHLQIPLKLNGALELLDMKNTVSIDTFTINERLSVNVSGLGFDGHIAGLFGHDGKRGLLNYGRLVVNHFNLFKPFECELLIDGKRTNHAPFILSLANSSQFGNNAFIAPNASVCDQRLDITLVNKMGVIQGLMFIRKLFGKTIHKSEFVQISHGREITIHTTKQVPYHIDGESAGTASTFKIVLNPSSLLLLIPSKSHPI